MPLTPELRGNPVARVFADDAAQLAETGSAEFPFVATSYRLTEHFHYWTKQPHQLGLAAATGRA